MKTILGIDIGTTGISSVLIDIEHNTILESHTVVNDSKLQTDSDLSECDVHRILTRAKQLIDDNFKLYPDIVSIGITGQMHGVLYVNESGKAVSNLYNWQDERGNRKLNQDRTYCEEVKERTGYTVYPGYGCSTLFYNRMNQLEPLNAKSFCTIMDYLVMDLTGNNRPLMHPTNAASFGLYNIENNCFDDMAIKKLGLSNLVLPQIAKEGEIAGYYKNIPVNIAIGDNQASFYGSVKDEKTSILLNFGTGSQVSVAVNDLKDVDENLEIRPYLFEKYLICGSALCGGKAYSILEKFFSEYAREINAVSGSQYEVMNVLAQKAYQKQKLLKVSTRFCGTRKNPDLRGEIAEIDDTNFTPGNLIVGVLQGMADELKTYFDNMDMNDRTELVASGNAVQKNKVLQMLLQDTFGFTVNLTDGREEAATGAAFYAGVNCGVICAEQVAEMITYRKE